MAGRPRITKSLPPGFRFGQAVKVQSAELRKPRLGIISHACKYDSGVQVKLTNPSVTGVSEYVCIQIENGDKLESIEK
jgi:hypothetical protein